MEFNQIEKRECIVMFNTMKILHTGARDAQERQAALLRSFVSRHVDTHTHIKKKEKKKAISFSLFFVFFFFWLACFEKRKKKLQRPVRLHSRKFLGQQPLQPDMSTNAPSSSISYTSGISIFFFFSFKCCIERRFPPPQKGFFFFIIIIQNVVVVAVTVDGSRAI